MSKAITPAAVPIVDFPNAIIPIDANFNVPTKAADDIKNLDIDY